MERTKVEDEMNMLREIFRLNRKVAELELEIDRLRSQNYITTPWIDSTFTPIAYEVTGVKWTS